MAEAIATGPRVLESTRSGREGFMLRHRRGMAAVALAGMVASGCSRGENLGGNSSDTASTTAAAQTSTSPATSVFTTPPAVGTTITGPSVKKGPLVPGSVHEEVRQYSSEANTGTFANPHTFAGAGPRIPGYQGSGDINASSVLVDCVLYDPSQAASSTAGLWYHLIGWKDHQAHTDQGGDIDGYWSPANTWWNQRQPQPPDLNQPVDSAVPLCPGSSPLPQ